MLLEGAGTITNAGAIDAGIPTGVAVQLSGPGSYLIVDHGATFSGLVVGNGGDIELASTTPSTLAGFDGNSITNFASLQFEPSAEWTISGTSGGSGLGTIAIGGFTANDTIDLNQLRRALTSASYNTSTGVLTLTNGGGFTTLNMTGGGLTTANFGYGTDGSAGTDLTFVATGMCFAAGTRIRTTNGQMAVEDLSEGDQVLTVSGRAQPIHWIGHRHVNFLNHPNRKRILPVRIAAHAFGPGLPERALVLSPDHSVFVEDVLIPIRHLINDTSIAQIECDTATYYHIELPRTRRAVGRRHAGGKLPGGWGARFIRQFRRRHPAPSRVRATARSLRHAVGERGLRTAGGGWRSAGACTPHGCPQRTGRPVRQSADETAIRHCHARCIRHV